MPAGRRSYRKELDQPMSHPNPPPKPTWRKPAGMFMILGIIAVLAWIVGQPICDVIGGWPVWMQAIVYLILGVDLDRASAAIIALDGNRKMARVTGLEPATSGVTGRRSNQLSYTRLMR
jgi:hypothetical protein